MSIPVSHLPARRTHRLIPSKHSHPVLSDLADTDVEMTAVFALDALTSNRLLRQADKRAGLDRTELVAGIPYASIINAAFCYPNPKGGRFNSPERGAWYAAFALEGAVAEVTFHHWRYLQEMGESQDEATKDEWCATFDGDFHDLREHPTHAALHSDPDTGYPVGQALAASLLAADAIGVIYPSVRAAHHTNIVCFRPALVMSPQRGATLKFTWDGNPVPVIEGWPERPLA